ncbi:MAG: hypothetical protein IJS22_09670 [Lachnospiraceae bacterium]|nr:hypothetical protein [Lachnospiraceae bacterium]
MKNLTDFLVLLDQILNEAEIEKRKAIQCDSNWEARDLIKIVIPEMTDLRKHAENGEIYFRFGRRQRMLESTYLITDSLKPIGCTPLGQMIAQLQDMYNGL